jgi:hypothetical protein
MVGVNVYQLQCSILDDKRLLIPSSDAEKLSEKLSIPLPPLSTEGDKKASVPFEQLDIPMVIFCVPYPKHWLLCCSIATAHRFFTPRRSAEDTFGPDLWGLSTAVCGDKAIFQIEKGKMTMKTIGRLGMNEFPLCIGVSDDSILVPDQEMTKPTKETMERNELE